eukprot:6387977-Amphidinium_carterae.1
MRIQAEIPDGQHCLPGMWEDSWSGTSDPEPMMPLAPPRTRLPPTPPGTATDKPVVDTKLPK